MDPDLYLQMARTRNEYCQLRAHCEILEHMVNGPGLRGCGLPKIGARAGTDFTMLRRCGTSPKLTPPALISVTLPQFRQLQPSSWGSAVLLRRARYRRCLRAAIRKHNLPAAVSLPAQSRC